MTEREKRIEEMAKVCCGETVSCDECLYYNYIICGALQGAKNLYDAGYRKVDKDGVFHIDISDELTKDFFQNEIKEAKKETIKEFVETVKMCLPKESYLHTWLREIAFGKFGVEVEE